jgi:ubiquinone/menaquinone biosynthesis C-methylase UbiE
MNTIAEYYDSNTEREWQRLVQDPYHSLEFLVTMHYIRKHFPPDGKVLDAGGGPGRYSIELCRVGYDVVLLDLSPGCIAIAKDKFQAEPEAVQNRLLGFAVGDIRDLSDFETDHFDAVLCLSPLTHISDQADRITATSELVRVAKPGAVICISVVGYLAMLRTVLMQCSHELVDPVRQKLIIRGDNLVGGNVWHFFRADELRRLAESFGLTTLDMAGCEGLSTGLRDATNLIGQDEAKWKSWVDLVLETSAEPAIVDMAEHILYIGSI